MFTSILVTISLILICFHYYVRGGRIGKYVDQLPGPPCYPLIGNILQFIGYTPAALWNLIREMNKKYYPIYRIWTDTVAAIYLTHPDDAEVLLSSTKHIEKSKFYNLLHPWLETGLLTSGGTKWQSRRKILTPAFHFNILKEFVDIFVEQSERLVDSIKADDEIIVKDIVTLFSEHTLNAICETAMGVSLHGRDKKFQNEYRQAVYAMGDILVHRFFRPWLHVNWIFNFTYQGKRQNKALKILHGFTNHIIEERKTYHDKTKGQYLNRLIEGNDDSMKKREEDVVVMGTKKKRLAMLDLLIAAHRNDNEINNDGIREEVDTFMFEGHDTTAMSVSFTVLLLGHHEEIQNRAREEVRKVLGENGNKIDMKVLQKLEYLERCIKESLRLYPSVPFISRAINSDLQLKNYLLPGGTIAHLFIYDLHRDPHFWPDPENFNPDRFLPENTRGRHPFSYIPFSAGSRNCIGQRFAMLELKAFVANLLNNYHFQSIDAPSDINFITDMVLRPAHPLRVKFLRIS